MVTIATCRVDRACHEALVQLERRRSFVEVEPAHLKRGILICGDAVSDDDDVAGELPDGAEIRTVRFGAGRDDALRADLEIQSDVAPEEACEVIARWIDDGCPGRTQGPVLRSRNA